MEALKHSLQGAMPIRPEATRTSLSFRWQSGKMFPAGRVAERLNASVSKTDVLVIVPGVQIPPLPIQLASRYR